MPYDYSTDFGGGVILAPALQTLCEEIKRSPKYSALTNLGEIGDRSHQNQGTSSDHNPFVQDPTTGKRLVRAIDLGGDRALLFALRDELHKLYMTHDPRLWPYGYAKGPDSLIWDWFGTGMHVDTGDEGHLHLSLTQRDGYNPVVGTGSFVAALNSRAPWGIGKPAKPVKPVTLSSWFPYPVGSGHVLGPVESPSAKVHGGIDEYEKRYVRVVQRIVGAPVTGVWHTQTSAKVRAWQSKNHRKVTGTFSRWDWRAARNLTGKKAAR